MAIAVNGAIVYIVGGKGGPMGIFSTPERALSKMLEVLTQAPENAKPTITVTPYKLDSE
jgi:hypothetical protein